MITVAELGGGFDVYTPRCKVTDKRILVESIYAETEVIDVPWSPNCCSILRQIFLNLDKINHTGAGLQMNHVQIWPQSDNITSKDIAIEFTAPS